MRTIHKKPEPKSLVEHRCQPHTDNYRADYKNYRDKDTLRNYLIAEQRGLCCYCMCRISVDQMKIEHWHCQDDFPDEQLNYDNLLAACLGNQRHPKKQQHCDTYKENSFLSRNPANPSHRVEDLIRYLGDGTITSDDPDFNAEINGAATEDGSTSSRRAQWALNLNLPVLKNNRKGVLDGFLKGLSIKGGTLSQSELQRMLNKWNGDDGRELLEPYCQVVIYWLRKKLARGQKNG